MQDNELIMSEKDLSGRQRLYEVVLLRGGPHLPTTVKAIRRLEPKLSFEFAKAIAHGEDGPELLLFCIDQDQAREARQVLDEAGCHFVIRPVLNV